MTRIRSSNLEQAPLRDVVPARAGGRARAIVAVVVLAVCLAGIDPASGAPDDVASAEGALRSATELRVAAEAHLAELTARRGALVAELGRLGEADAQITEELAEARSELREFAVAAYIDGGQSDLFRAALDPEQAQALAWQSSMSAGRSSSASEAAAEFDALRRANSPRRNDAAARLDRLDEALLAARFDAIQASAHERDAESALATAREEAAARAAAARAAAARAAAARAAQDAEIAASASAAAEAAASASTAADPVSAPTAAGPGAAAPAPSSQPGRGTPTPSESATLARIRQCESGGNYSIVSASGRYRGAYQFDRTTWRGVGGVGDPAAASPAEQDYRALLLLRLRGTRPWPICGR